MNPAEQRAAILELCRAFADARLTNNPLVINAVATDIEHVRLPRIIPDLPAKTTLADILK